MLMRLIGACVACTTVIGAPLLALGATPPTATSQSATAPASAPAPARDGDDVLDRLKANALLREAERIAGKGNYWEARAICLSLIKEGKLPDIVSRADKVMRGLPLPPPEQQREEARIAEADHLARMGKLAEAREIYRSVLRDSRDPNTFVHAKDALSKLPVRSSLAAKLAEAWDGAVANLIWPAILLAFVLVLLAVRHGWRSRAKAWVLDPISGDESHTMAGLILSVLAEVRARVPSRAIGHLAVAAQSKDTYLRFGAAPGEALDVPTEGLGELGPVKVGAFAKTLAALPRWFRGATKRITGRVISSEGKFAVELCVWHSNKKVATAAAAGSDDPAGRALAVREASEKMLHIMVYPGALSTEASLVREGRMALDEYLAQRGAQTLERAIDCFEQAAVAGGEPDVPRFYLGVAYDLNEQHDEAIQIMRALSEASHDKKLRGWAVYNEAVARLRKYKPEELRAAQDLLERHGPRPEARGLVPLEAFILLKLAEVHAHKPLLSEFRNASDNARGRVYELTDRVKKSTPQSPCEGWSQDLLSTCRWSIHNARGNVLLNMAMKLDDSQLPAGDLDETAGRRRSKLCEQALVEFRHTEVEGTPGVETLSNLGTTLDCLGRLKQAAGENGRAELQEAEQYLERCIRMNSRYEYAYYRLTQHWAESMKMTDRAIGTLDRFRATGLLARIPSFAKLIEELQKTAQSRNGDAPPTGEE